MSLVVIVLAAGAGKRTGSRIPKPLLPLGGATLIEQVINTARQLKPQKTILVISPDSEIPAAINDAKQNLTYATQPRPLGTADAVRAALPHIGKRDTALILCADTPLLTPRTLKKLVKVAGKDNLAILTFSPTEADDRQYGEVFFDKSGKAERIIEYKDRKKAGVTTDPQFYSGVMALPAPLLQTLLPQINNKNAAKEHYLTDLIALARKAGKSVLTHRSTEEECEGVNTLIDLAVVETRLRIARIQTLLDNGVVLRDPERIQIRGNVRVAAGTIIDANVILQNSTIGARCHISANTHIIDSKIGAACEIKPFSLLQGARIGDGCTIGPFAHLRPGTRLDAAVRIGNFVETKATRIKTGGKAMHLSYLGDAHIGENANIGAGVITCNYDGETKHPTHIGDRVFIGSDSQLVAPVKIAADAYIGAGTTVTKDIGRDTLTVSRSPQKSIPRRPR